MKSQTSSRANSVRIVACVNACAGIDAPAELRRQRDALLEACKGLLGGVDLLANEFRRGFAMKHAEASDVVAQVERSGL